MENRRNVLKTLAAAPMFVPRSVWGANDRPAYGLIGTGGRGRYLNKYFQSAGAQCVALCDVYDVHLKAALKDSPKDAKTYVDYNDLLAQKGIDFVVSATPDHQHSPTLLAGLAAGKDVYLEKPMSKSLEQSQKMIAAVRKTDRIVQIGMQRRSAPTVIKSKKLIDDGIVGRISMIKPMWNWQFAKPLDNRPLPGQLDWKRFLGDAPDQPLEPMRFRWWRAFWDFSGGNMTDQGTHLMDVTQWFGNDGNPPLSALQFGQVQKMTGAQAPDVFCGVFEYPNFMATWTLDYSSSYENDWSITIMGDRGTMVLSDQGYKVYKEPWKDPKNRTPILEEASPIPIETHIQNFLDCIKSRQQPNATVEVGAKAVAAPHLANLAFHQNRRVSLAPDGVTTA
jgi:predicted dehydrogenase